MNHFHDLVLSIKDDYCEGKKGEVILAYQRQSKEFKKKCATTSTDISEHEEMALLKGVEIRREIEDWIADRDVIALNFIVPMVWVKYAQKYQTVILVWCELEAILNQAGPSPRIPGKSG